METLPMVEVPDGSLLLLYIGLEFLFLCAHLSYKYTSI